MCLQNCYRLHRIKVLRNIRRLSRRGKLKQVAKSEVLVAGLKANYTRFAYFTEVLMHLLATPKHMIDFYNAKKV